MRYALPSCLTNTNDKSSYTIFQKHLPPDTQMLIHKMCPVLFNEINNWFKNKFPDEHITVSMIIPNDFKVHGHYYTLGLH